MVPIFTDQRRFQVDFDLVAKFGVNRVHRPGQRRTVDHRIVKTLGRVLPLVGSVLEEVRTSFRLHEVCYPQGAALAYLEFSDWTRRSTDWRRLFFPGCRGRYSYERQVAIAAMQQFVILCAISRKFDKGIASDS